MWIGWLEFDLLLGDVHSLKQKRSVVRPVIAELHRKFGVSAAETGSQGLHRRAGIGVAMASADRRHAVDVLGVRQGSEAVVVEGHAGVADVAVGVGEERETVEEVAEPFLVRSGLLARTPRGRVATPAAWEHLGLVVPRGAPFAGGPESSLFDE